MLYQLHSSACAGCSARAGAGGGGCVDARGVAEGREGGGGGSEAGER